jgi:hypothetical protein
VTIDPIPTPPTAPMLGTVTQPSCANGGGSVDVSGLPAVGNWVITRNPGGATTPGSGATTTLSNIPAGNYTFTVTKVSTACTSVASAPLSLIPVANTPATPVIDSTTQIMCGQTTGKVYLSSLPVGNWTFLIWCNQVVP